MNTKTSAAALVILVLALAACSRSTQRQRQGASKGKSATAGGRIVLQNKGSDTLVNVAQAWAEAYRKVNPNVAVAVTGGGSGTGVAALINGTVDIANMSRSVKAEEKTAAEKKGIHPMEHTVGFDALAVYIHKNNPIEKFTLEQIADIYGEGGKTNKWSQIRSKVPGCDSDEIVLVSRQNNSGTYEYFREVVLGKKREFRLGSRDLHGSKDVVDLVAKTPCAIGYSGLAYASEEVKMPCIVKGETCIVPSEETAANGTYPIARPLFMYTNGAPKGALKEYLDWILSDPGQCIITKLGYAPARKVTCK